MIVHSNILFSVAMTTTAALLFLCFCAPITTAFRIERNGVTDGQKPLLRFSRETVLQHSQDEEEDREEELMWCCNIPEDNSLKNDISREQEKKDDEKVVQECRTEVTNILGDEPAPKNKARIRKEMEVRLYILLFFV
ncbi:hypothetical protein L9F63_025804 [Diploptera punctata]|uniref:Transmembrane protein n=1 Tax=Diploptera punctata TaxID=6984 RepID=A0AAD8E3I2_DIPPU|nr:hypothetical protein L9F63_025804 [Diploptera punctata]